MKTKSKIISAHMAAIGRKGGRAGTGKAKARTSEQARKAALIRWEKWREENDRRTNNI